MKEILYPVMGALLFLGVSCSGKTADSQKEGNAAETEQTVKSESKDTDALLATLNELSVSLEEAKNAGQATQMMVKFNTSLNEYAKSKEKITKEQRTALTEAFVKVLKGMISTSVKGENVDLDDPQVKEYVEGQLATVKEKFETSTANAGTLGEYIQEADRAMK